MPRPRKIVTIEDAQKIIDATRERVRLYYARKKEDVEFSEKRREYYRLYQYELYHRKKTENKLL